MARKPAEGSSKQATRKTTTRAATPRKPAKPTASPKPRPAAPATLGGPRGGVQHEFPAPAAKAAAAGKSIDDLDLVDYAAEAARKLLAAHPSVIFTSGRRNVKQQADAMAGNVVKNRTWIAETYKKTAERDSLQKWIDDHPAAKTRPTLSAGLEGIMNGWTDAQKRNLSRHFSGQAFDIQPVAGGDAIKKTIKSLPRLRKFLDKEGGLTLWHADFE